MKRLTYLLILITFFSLANSFTAQAQEDPFKINDLSEQLPLSNDSIADTIGKVVTFILGFVGALAVLMIVAGGIMYIVSKGDRGMMETAQGIITWAVVGLVISLLGWIIVNTVIGSLGGSGGSNSSNDNFDFTNDRTNDNSLWDFN